VAKKLVAMKKVWAVAVIVACGWAASAAPVGAQAFSAFGLRPQSDLVVPAFGDGEVGGLIGTLDRLLASPPAGATWGDHAAGVLWEFARRIQAGRLTPAQETRVVEHLDRLARSRPEAAAAVRGPRRMIRELTVGKTAPDITGTDLDGRALTLSDYRDKVVVLVFSAEWCAICRTQAPYERFLLERYERWPFALLGVQTGSNREAARTAQAASRLSHRSWWDVPPQGQTTGPIATAWNVIGWPASYVIDSDGVIRFVDLRDEDLLKAVRQLLEAQADRDAKVTRSR
jgi:peroxiredoxin